MKFVHSGDIHFEHTKNMPNLNLRLENTSKILEHMVETCLEEDADAFFLAGDLFETGKASHNDVERFVDILRPLAQNKVETVIIAGNHDVKRIPYGHRTPLHRIPDASDFFHVIFDIDSLELKSGLKVVGFPWVMKKMLLDFGVTNLMEESLGEGNKDMSDFFVNKFSDLCEEVEPHVVLGHFTVTDILPEYRGSEVEMSNDPWEHTVPSSLLADIGADYVGLGHIHKAAKLADNVFYPGAPERFTMREAEDEKFFHLVDISANQLHIEKVTSKAREAVFVDSIESIERNAKKLNNPYTIVKIVGDSYSKISILEEELKKFEAKIIGIENREVSTLTENLEINASQTNIMSPLEGLKEWVKEHKMKEEIVKEFTEIIEDSND